jgi:RNA polymerase sigma factor (sigma-70 family)
VDHFQTTRWSVVLEAREGSERSRRALEKLCRTYRAPVVAFIRSHGIDVVETEDLAQTFLARFIERSLHAQADPQRGRFRAFLLTALKHFLADAVDLRQTIKRGGNVQFRSLDSGIDSQTSLESVVDGDTPERYFDRAWAQAVLHSALRKLRREAKAAGKGALFDTLGEFLIERPDEADYARVAAALGMRRNTLAVAVHRLRSRLRELVHAELAETAADRNDLELELEQFHDSLGALLD